MAAPVATKREAAKASEETLNVSSVAEAATAIRGRHNMATVLIRPHVTEKATDLSATGVYVFDIHKSANKMHVREAILQLYKVKPTRVNIVNRKAKMMRNPRTGRSQVRQKGSKKALVYLKSGDKIEFV